ncbi:MAG: ATP-grasp domain-containing protein [Pseudonocardiaceae bacterium]
MGTGDVVVMTDHGSGEGSRPLLEAAVEILTGTHPGSIDARHFMTGGSGRATAEGGTLRLGVPSEDLVVTPNVLVVYEIPPGERRRFETFQRTVLTSGSTCWAANVDGWRAATDKHQTVAWFRRDGITHMDTITLCRPSPDSALDAFNRLGRDVWARPRTGAGGKDVFHLTTIEDLHDARRHYAASGQDWLVSRDARNVDHHGRRHQFRVVVLHDRVLRVCEHVQADPDAPCNESRGAMSTTVPVDDFPPEFAQLAISATRSLGLPFGGVDLAIENGGVVFEVNVHPVIDVPGGLETLAIPLIQDHLSPR